MAMAAIGPPSLRAQQADRVYRVGVLMARTQGDLEGEKQAAALRQGLRDLGWKLGQSLQIDYRWSVGDAAKALAASQELAALNPDVLVANGTPSLRAMMQATSSIPIVFVSVADPLGQGFVPSLARPGGHLTGFSVEEASMGGKWLDYLKEAAPRVSHVAIIFNPETAPYAAMFRPTMDEAAPRMGVTLAWSPVHSAMEIERVAETVAATQDGALLVIPDSFTFAQRELLIAVAARHRLPAIYPIRFFAIDGGLLAYGIDRVDLFRRAADYVHRIIKGTPPGELPVQQPTKFELAINLKTAKTLGLTIPQSLLLSADDVIE
jgi:putative ABC transport system substrate-binding protein